MAPPPPPLPDNLADWQWELSLFGSWQLDLIFFSPLALVVLASILTYGYHRKAAEERFSDASEPVKKSLSPTSMWESLMQGLQFDLTAHPPISSYFGTSKHPLATKERSANKRRRLVGPQSFLCEADIRSAYEGDALDPDGIADAAVLIIRLGAHLVANGQNTVEAESMLAALCHRWDIKTATIDLSLRQMTAQMGPQYPTHFIAVGADFRLSLLTDWMHVYEHIVVHRPPLFECLDACDAVEDRPPPFGWFVRLIALEIICTCAPVSVYGGNYYDMFCGALIAPVVMVFLRVLALLKRAHLELLVVAFTVGMMAPVLWELVHYLYDAEQCHAGDASFGVLIVWLPGLQLIYGVHEIRHGSFINGSARLSKAMVSAIFIALCLTIGWQIFGRNWASDTVDTYGVPDPYLWGVEGPRASLPPSKGCSQVHVSWKVATMVITIPMQAATMVFYELRFRDWFGPYLVGWVTYAVQGALQNACTDTTCALPHYVVAVFVGGTTSSLACFNELTSGIPWIICVIPTILILAPGAGAVRAALGNMHRKEGDFASFTDTMWESLVTEGASYAAGFFLAVELWSPLLSLRRDVHAIQNLSPHRHSRLERPDFGRRNDDWIWHAAPRAVIKVAQEGTGKAHTFVKRERTFGKLKRALTGKLGKSGSKGGTPGRKPFTEASAANTAESGETAKTSTDSSAGASLAKTPSVVAFVEPAKETAVQVGSAEDNV